MSDGYAASQRVAVALVVFLTAATFTSRLADPVNVVKLTLLLVGALAVVALEVARAAHRRTLLVPPTAVGAAAGLLLIGLLAATAASPNTASAVIGAYGRNSGLLAYVAALVLFALGSRLWTPGTLPVLALSYVAAAAFTAGYGLFQYAGVDAIAWNNEFNPIIGAMGNPDFASGYLGICAPLAVWGVLWNGWPALCRVTSGVIAVMCLAAMLLSSSVQGPLAAAAGLGVLAAAWLLERGGRTAWRGLVGLAVAGVAGASLLAAGAAHVGPASGLLASGSLHIRVWYWQAALTMLGRSPVSGVGLDQYGAFWAQERPTASAVALGGDHFTDAAHSVPLQMLAQGGLLLGGAYIAFTGLVVVSLVRALRRHTGQARLLAGGIGGAWTAYVVQSLVSIDQVPLITAQFTLAGGLVALANWPARDLRLRGAPAPKAYKTGGKRRVASARPRSLAPVDTIVMGTASVALLVLSWLALTPLRANAAAHRGDVSAAGGDAAAAQTQYRRATAIAPGVSAYWLRLGGLQEQVNQPAQAMTTYRRGVARDRRSIALVRDLARVAETSGAESTASDAYARAVVLDPKNSATVGAAAAYELRHGRPQRAARYVEPAVAELPREASLWVVLGHARLALGDKGGARVAYQQAVLLNAQDVTARAALADLG